MRRFIQLVMVIFVLFVCTCTTFAAGCTQDVKVIVSGVVQVECVCTGSGVDGSIDTQTLNATAMKEIKGMYLYQVVVRPGTVVPDAASLLVYMKGRDVLGGKGTNIIHATNTQDTFPYSTFMATYVYPMVIDTITFEVTGQNTQSAQYIIDYIFVR